MDEKNAVVGFWKAANENNEQAAEQALRKISRETVNQEDGDGYDFLITAVQNGNACAVKVLLKSGLCDLGHRENLCGMTAGDFAAEYPENSPVRKAFETLAAKENK